MQSEQLFDKAYDLYEFTETSQTILSDYLCSLCNGVYNDPLLDACGHIFCRNCIILQIELYNICPIENKELKKEQLFDVKILSSKIQKQIIYCKNKKKGCPWEGPLIDLKVHLINQCDFRIFSCVNESCDFKAEKEEILNHKENCLYRNFTCEFCLSKFKVKDELQHYEICPKKIFYCPNNCHKKMERREIEDHIQNVCDETPLECIYGHLGCQIKAKRREFLHHEEEELLYHLRLINQEILRLKNLKNFDFEKKFENLEENFRIKINSNYPHRNEIEMNIQDNKSFPSENTNLNTSKENVIENKKENNLTDIMPKFSNLKVADINQMKLNNSSNENENSFVKDIKNSNVNIMDYFKRSNKPEEKNTVKKNFSGKNLSKNKKDDLNFVNILDNSQEGSARKVVSNKLNEIDLDLNHEKKSYMKIKSKPEKSNVEEDDSEFDYKYNKSCINKKLFKKNSQISKKNKTSNTYNPDYEKNTNLVTRSKRQTKNLNKKIINCVISDEDSQSDELENLEEKENNKKNLKKNKFDSEKIKENQTKIKNLKEKNFEFTQVDLMLDLNEDSQYSNEEKKRDENNKHNLNNAYMYHTEESLNVDKKLTKNDEENKKCFISNEKNFQEKIISTENFFLTKKHEKKNKTQSSKLSLQENHERKTSKNSSNQKNLTELNKNSELLEKNSLNSICFDDETNLIEVDSQNIPKGLLVNVNNVLDISYKESSHKFALTNFPLNNKNFKWRVSLKIKSKWIAVGVCLKETIIENNYKFINTLCEDNRSTHGFFGISSNGYIWNCKTNEEDNIKREFIKFDSDQNIILLYDFVKESLLIEFNKEKIILSNVSPQDNYNLVPCVIFLKHGDSATFYKE